MGVMYMEMKELGFIGLGKMGSNIVLQLLGKGYRVVVYNRTQEKMQDCVKAGAIPSKSIHEMVGKLSSKRKVVWVMLSAEATSANVEELCGHLSEGDIVVDGSNSYYKESIRISESLKNRKIQYVDAGCSGGPSGALHGMCIMAGGDKETFSYLKQLFADCTVPEGLLYTGPAGSGHFVKMVHNAIEYGMMQSLSEGLELLNGGPFKGLDISSICNLWDHGSVIEGKLVRLAALALNGDNELKGIAPYVEDTGEGRWSVITAMEHDIPAASISFALFNRFKSRSDTRYSDRVLAALRHQFGQHEVKKLE
jgi:6-phosphogluconate dehydrogenase